MKELGIDDIQRLSLEIMKDVHDFCVKNNIKYTLQGGSLIGAIRHKGFIPWDDDLDIAMPRPDYERFVKLYKSSNGYTVISREGGDDSVDILFARVCESEKTICKTISPWCKANTGVWIDVFPLDGAPNDLKQVEKKVNKWRKLWAITLHQRIAKNPFSNCHSIKRIIGKLVYVPYLLYGDLIGRLNNEIKQIDFGSTSKYSNFSFLQYGIRECHRCDVISDRILVPFEDYSFYVMKGYDEALKEKYGDYMQLPPIEDRVRKHSINTFYWK